MERKKITYKTTWKSLWRSAQTMWRKSFMLIKVEQKFKFMS
jgi:hypothetical protein